MSPSPHQRAWYPQVYTHSDWPEFAYHTSEYITQTITELSQPRYFDHIFGKRIEIPSELDTQYCRSLAISTYLYYLNKHAETLPMLQSPEGNFDMPTCQSLMTRWFSQYLGYLLTYYAPNNLQKTLYKSWYESTIPGALIIDATAITRLQAGKGDTQMYQSRRHVADDPDAQPEYEISHTDYILIPLSGKEPVLQWDAQHQLFVLED